MIIVLISVLVFWNIVLTAVLIGMSYELNQEDRGIRSWINEVNTKYNKEIWAIMDHLKLMFKDEPSHLSCVKRTNKKKETLPIW